MRLFAKAAPAVTIMIFLASAAQAQNGPPPGGGAPPGEPGGGDRRVLSDKMAAVALVPEMAATIDVEVPGGLAGPHGSLKDLYSGVTGGEGQSFPLQWTAGPEATKSYALILQDTPTPAPPFPNMAALHWGVYNIPGEVTALPGNIPPGADVAGVAGAAQIADRAGNPRYAAPGAPILMRVPTTPPENEEQYGLYTLQLFALDTVLDLNPGATYDEFIAAAAGHVLAYGIEPVVLNTEASGAPGGPPGAGGPPGGPPGAGGPGAPPGAAGTPPGAPPA